MILNNDEDLYEEETDEDNDEENELDTKDILKNQSKVIIYHQLDMLSKEFPIDDFEVLLQQLNIQHFEISLKKIELQELKDETLHLNKIQKDDTYCVNENLEVGNNLFDIKLKINEDV